MTSAIVKQYVRNLYGSPENPAYGPALIALAESLGWDIHTGKTPICQVRLERANHRCGSMSCYQHGEFGRNVRGRNLDHVVWFVRKDPKQWALLSQPYSSDDPGGTAVNLGPAPYGHGTTALLYVGVPQA